MERVDGSIERALSEIGRGLAASRGQPFLPALVEHLARAVGATYAVVCKLDRPDQVRMAALWSEAGGPQSGAIRELVNTPCAEVVGRRMLSFPEGVQAQFPQDELLSALGIEGYIGAPLFDSEGNPLGLLGVLDTKPLEQVSLIESLLGVFAKLASVELEREAAFASYQASERRQAAFLQSAPFGVYSYALDEHDQLVLTAVNDEAIRHAWQPLERLFGKPIEEAFPFLAGTDLPAAYTKVARDGGFWSEPGFEIVDGEHRVVLEMYAFPTSPGSVAVMFNDITERIQSQETIRASEELLQAFVANAPFGAYFVELTASGALVLVGSNPAADQITGVDSAGLVGLEVLDAFPALAKTQLPRIYREIARGQRGPFHDPRLKYDGAQLVGVFDVHVFCVRSRRVAVLFRDVTSSARAEEAERSSERLEATATLAGGIAHELNNLMGGVLGGVSLLRRGGPEAETFDDTLSQVAAAAGRASELAHQLLAYARGGKYEVQPLDVNAAVLQVVRRAREALPETVTLHTDLEPSLSLLSADRNQVLLVLRCLLTNALEAVDPSGGLVVIRTSEELLSVETAARLAVDRGTYAVITVADDGPGIAPDVQERVFEPFFSTRAQGRGMGLAAAFGIARNHGGAIEIVPPPAVADPSRDPRAGLNEGAQPPTAPMKRPTGRPPVGSDLGPCPPLELCGGAVFRVYLPLQESRGSFQLASEFDPRGREAPAWIQASGVLEGVGSLALGVAHDFNNLLAIALNELSLLRREGTPELEGLEVVYETVQKCRRLTERLLALGRGTAAEHRPLSVNEVAKDVGDLLRGALDPGIELELALRSDLPTVVGARTLIENALLNLCFNARDAMPQGGVLRLETACDDDASEVWVRVSDTGVGMTDEVLRRSREPLFTTKSRSGTGLGLAMANQVARSHGGRLEVSSTPDVGTQVTIVLPAAETVEGARPRQGRVLMIDDSEHLTRSTAQLLELEGFQVDTAANGEDAMALFEREAYDLVLLDVVLPGMSGEAVFERLRALRPDQPVVVCSGYGRQERVRDLVRGGAVFLGKPFLIEELLARIAEAIRKATGP